MNPNVEGVTTDSPGSGDKARVNTKLATTMPSALHAASVSLYVKQEGNTIEVFTAARLDLPKL